MHDTWQKIGLALVVLVILGILALIGIHRWGRQRAAETATRYERLVGPLDPAVHAPPDLATEENAAALLLQAENALSWSNEARSAVVTMASKPVDAWTQEERRSLLGVLEGSEAAHDLFRRAVELERSSLRSSREDDALLRTLRAEKYLQTAARLSWTRGDRDQALAHAAAARRVVEVLEGEGDIITLLVGLAAEQHLHHFLRLALQTKDLSADTLDRLDELVPEARLRVHFRRALAHDAATMDRQLQERSEGTAALATKVVLGPLANADLQRSHLALVEASSWPLPRLASTSHLDIETSPVTGFISSIAAPNLLLAVRRLRASEAIRSRTRLALHLRRERLERGTYPEDLSLLTASLDSDPFAGLELRYVRPDEGGAVLGLDVPQPVVAALPDPIGSQLIETWNLP